MLSMRGKRPMLSQRSELGFVQKVYIDLHIREHYSLKYGGSILLPLCPWWQMLAESPDGRCGSTCCSYPAYLRCAKAIYGYLHLVRETVIVTQVRAIAEFSLNQSIVFCIPAETQV